MVGPLRSRRLFQHEHQQQRQEEPHQLVPSPQDRGRLWWPTATGKDYPAPVQQHREHRSLLERATAVTAGEDVVIDQAHAYLGWRAGRGFAAAVVWDVLIPGPFAAATLASKSNRIESTLLVTLRSTLDDLGFKSPVFSSFIFLVMLFAKGDGMGWGNGRGRKAAQMSADGTATALASVARY